MKRLKSSVHNSESKHIHIVSDVGLLTGPLGYILQQSPSIDSRWFKFSEKGYKNFDNYNDPWDSRTWIFDKTISVKKQYVDICEDITKQYTTKDLDEFVDRFKVRTVFGMNHGAWKKHVEWRNPKVQCVFVDITQNTAKYFLSLISNRLVDNVDESILHHVIDHKNSDNEYLKKIRDVIYSRSHLQKEPIRFWQLQYTYWIDNNYFPLIDEKKETFDKEYIKMITKNTTREHNYVVYTKPMIINIETLDLKSVCKDLNIVYTDRMETQYRKFKKFFDFHVQM